MKRFANTVLAAVTGVAMPLAAAAQQQVSTPPLPGETALQYAQRINACNGASILGADFTEGGTMLQVQCPATGTTGDTSGMSGGLGGAVASVAVVIALFSLAGGSGSYTPSTTSTN
ncbi:MAG: hypothetical protein K8F31_02965 [Roseovarius sp.]|nr:hypothetical protein [Roseovarius sp.]